MAAKKKILVVDDERDLVDLLALRFQSEGYDVIQAFDGMDGLEKVRANNPDLIILDVMMPRLNGYQVCRELKQDVKFKKIPIIMLTAKAQESDKFWGMETGAEGYITKPFDFGNLSETVKKFLLNT